jgi:hypothetical protein
MLIGVFNPISSSPPAVRKMESRSGNEMVTLYFSLSADSIDALKPIGSVRYSLWVDGYLFLSQKDVIALRTVIR